MEQCLLCLCCCRCFKKEKNNIIVPDLNTEDIHQYVPFENLTSSDVGGNIYWDSVKLKQKLEGRSRERK